MAKILWVPALLLGTTGCVVHFGHWGGGTEYSNGDSDIVVRDGRVYVDGVELKHDRWVEVTLPAPASGKLAVGTATGEISLSGTPDAGLRLEAHLYSEFEGDGRVVVEDDELQPTSDTGKVFINGLRGSLPAGLELTASTGTGTIAIDGMTHRGTLAVASGTGPTTVANCAVRTLKVDMGTATIRLDAVRADLFDVETGTGDLRIEGGGGKELEVDTGTGDVVATEASFDSVRVDSGTGDVVFRNCTLGTVKVDSGTGDLTLRGGTCEEVDLDSGTGDLRLRDGAVVGVKREG